MVAGSGKGKMPRPRGPPTTALASDPGRNERKGTGEAIRLIRTYSEEFIPLCPEKSSDGFELAEAGEKCEKLP